MLSAGSDGSDRKKKKKRSKSPKAQTRLARSLTKNHGKIVTKNVNANGTGYSGRFELSSVRTKLTSYCIGIIAAELIVKLRCRLT